MSEHDQYAEFDDCVWFGSYCTSKKATAAIGRLLHTHRLTAMHNPGGIGIEGPTGFRCQLSGCDDVYDLNKLRAAVQRAGLE